MITQHYIYITSTCLQFGPVSCFRKIAQNDSTKSHFSADTVDGSGDNSSTQFIQKVVFEVCFEVKEDDGKVGN